ncbi:MAG: sulfide-dependent adenosine diphosphate thiazole synthase [Planctomycetota bacterium]|jgi:thiamine thiazole synthase
MAFSNTGITRAIVQSFSDKFLSSVESDCLIAGAGPSGLYAAYLLAKGGANVTVVEKRLSPGGGIWGGGMTMNDIVIQEEAKAILDELEIGTRKLGDVYLVDSVEFASGLCYRAMKAGATILNVMVVEDVAVRDGRVTGLVVNRSTVYGALHVDPLVLEAKVTVDATGHDAAVVEALLKHGVEIKTRTGSAVGEGPMDAPEGERFVVENTGEVYPGLLVSGMAVCAAFGGPRMGPIFGGMLLSGAKIAELVQGVIARA